MGHDTHTHLNYTEVTLNWSWLERGRAGNWPRVSAASLHSGGVSVVV